MAVSTPAELDRTKIKQLIEREEQALNERTKGSGEMYTRAQHSLSGGVASSYQLRDPWPIYLERGDGPRVWDVDGNEYYDFHNGFGSMVQGHAHPAIGRAISERYALGTHFAAPTEDAIVVGEELSRRWDLPRWRYTNSGSESTMDAIRIARAYTKRETIMKIFGSYHGHHDGVMVSIGVDYDKIGDRFHLESLAYGAGIPQAVVDLTIAVPFNDLEATERRIEALIAEDRKPACVIMEAAMMNLGIVLPEPGYLEGMREITQRHGIVLIFDEVKTGLCIAAGGATERWGVKPDMVTLAKALGGDRRQRGGHVGRRGRQRLPGRHVQRQPARHGGLAREPARGPHARRLHPPRRSQRAHPQGLLGRDREAQSAGLLDRRGLQGLRHVLAREDRRLRDVRRQPGRRPRRAGVAVQHEPRHLHDAGARGGVDAVGDPHRRVDRRLRGRVRGDGFGDHRIDLPLAFAVTRRVGTNVISTSVQGIEMTFVAAALRTHLLTSRR
jgi:4-aminobutyrate aminotransferase-like enzyme